MDPLLAIPILLTIVAIFAGIIALLDYLARRGPQTVSYRRT